VSLAIGLALGATTISTSSAGASPQTELAGKMQQARQLEAQIQANAERADALDEQYLQAQSAVEDAKRQIADAEAAIASARAHESTLRSQLGGRAALLYIGAGNGDPLNIDATNVQELGSRAKYGEAAAETDNKMIDQLGALDEQLNIQEKELQGKKADAEKREKEADTARKAVEQASAQMQHLLDSTRSDIRLLANKIEQDRLRAE